MKTKNTFKDKLLFVVAIILVLISLVKVGMETYESLSYKQTQALRPLLLTEFTKQAESISSAFNYCKKVGESNDI